jgi:hypothetical protein
LLQAFIYSGKKEFGHLIDLDKYFKNITHITTAASFKTSVDVFKDNAVEILDAMARSKEIVFLKLSPYTHYTKDIAQRIGNFLKESSSIIDVDLSSTNSARAWTRLNHETITAIAEALETNTSITYLNLSGMELGDKGILKILHAIQKNPNSKLSHLCLNDCGMTKSSGEAILDMVAECSPLKKVESEWITKKLDEDWRRSFQNYGYQSISVRNEKARWDNDDSSDDSSDYRPTERTIGSSPKLRMEDRTTELVDPCGVM